MKTPMDVIRDLRHHYQTWRLVVLAVRDGKVCPIGEFGERSARIMAQYATPSVEYQHTDSFNPDVATQFLGITRRAIAEPSKENIEKLWDPLQKIIDDYAIETGNEGETRAAQQTLVDALKKERIFGK